MELDKLVTIAFWILLGIGLHFALRRYENESNVRIFSVIYELYFFFINIIVICTHSEHKMQDIEISQADWSATFKL